MAQKAADVGQSRDGPAPRLPRRVYAVVFSSSQKINIFSNWKYVYLGPFQIGISDIVFLLEKSLQYPHTSYSEKRVWSITCHYTILHTFHHTILNKIHVGDYFLETRVSDPSALERGAGPGLQELAHLQNDARRLAVDLHRCATRRRFMLCFRLHCFFFQIVFHLDFTENCRKICFITQRPLVRIILPLPPSF